MLFSPAKLGFGLFSFAMLGFMGFLTFLLNYSIVVNSSLFLKYYLIATVRRSIPITFELDLNRWLIGRR